MSREPAVPPPAGGRGTDGLRLQQALSIRMLPSMVAAMSFLGALALAGAAGAHGLAQRWSQGAGTLLSIQVPDPDANAPGASESRIQAVSRRLEAARPSAQIRRLDAAELQRLLRPWLGPSPAPTGATTAADTDAPPMPMPGVIEVRLAPGEATPDGLEASLAAVAPGALVEDGALWSDRLLRLTTSLEACAALAVATVAVTACCVVALATRGGIAVRRQAIELLHGLGASDGYIAGRFARRAARLALSGGAAGALLALPLLGGLAHLAAPFAAGRLADAASPAAGDAPISPSGLPSGTPSGGGMTHQALGFLALLLPDRLPLSLWLALPGLPLAAGLIGWLTAQGTVRVWLRRLP